jgi:hypothetical protein
MKAGTEETLAARSPLQRYKDAEKNLVEKWETELTAAIEAEYRRQRSDLLTVLQWWLRDIWVQTFALNKGSQGARMPEKNRKDTAEAETTKLKDLLRFPELKGTVQVAQRISPKQALENLEIVEQLHRWLGTNVQEALALEVGLLKLHF